MTIEFETVTRGDSNDTDVTLDGGQVFYAFCIIRRILCVKTLGTGFYKKDVSLKISINSVQVRVIYFIQQLYVIQLPLEESISENFAPPPSGTNFFSTILMTKSLS